MLTKEEIEKIEHEAKKFPYRKAAAIEALLLIQKERRYIDNDILENIAHILDMSPSELDSIATFYNLIYRKPVGEKVVRICDSVSCYILGYEDVLTSIKEYLKVDFGQTTHDKKFTLLPAQCLGCCDKGPAMMINDELYCHLNKNNVLEILKPPQAKGP